MTRRVFAAICLAISLSACAVPPRGSNSSSSGTTTMPQSTVEVEDSNFEPAIKFVGITTEYRNFSGGGSQGTYFRRWMLRSWMVKNTGKTTHQLYVSDLYSSNEWRFWVRANDQSAKSLKFTSIDQKVDGCNRNLGCRYTEVFGAEIDDADLRKASDIGSYCVKFYARSGDSEVICLSRFSIMSQLEAIDARRPQPGSSSRPPRRIP